MKILKSKVHQFCEDSNIKIEFPKSLKNEEEQKTFIKYKADIAVVAAYGLILPKEILNGTKYGCINLHPSLLPRWRGAAPIQRTIMSGDDQTAMCIMQMEEGLDTGDIILQENLSIPNDVNAGYLHDTLANLGAEMTLEAINLISEGKSKPKAQSNEGIIYANKITKEDEEINFNKPGEVIINQIKGLSPYPAAYFKYKEKKYKIFEAIFEECQHGEKFSSIIDEGRKIACMDGFIKPTIIQKEGKKRMEIEDFLRGNKF